MPELPEVETTRRGLSSAATGRRIERVVVRERRLRWPVPTRLGKFVAGQRIESLERRAKYLIFNLERGAILLHLGMSGSLRLLSCDAPVLLHDHLDLVLETDQCLRLNDPRRFGSVLWTSANPLAHPLLSHLGPEPLSDDFDGAYLARAARRRRIAIKQFLMTSQVVVGVGNIYASEALFRAGIRPRRAAGRLKRSEYDALAAAIKTVLKDAIRAGGTTLRDYVNPQGTPGYFRQKLYVYERADEPCLKCQAPIRHLVQGQRSTYFCPTCQH